MPFPDRGPAAEEAPVEIEYNGKKLATLLCTPQELQALALGWLYTQGLVKGLDEVVMLGACDTMQRMRVITKVDRSQEGSEWRQIITSGCGGGSISEKLLQDHPEPVKSDLVVSLAEISDLIKRMLAGATIHRETGGVHAAALGQNGEIVALAEDVGRHNAVDKVIGKALLQKIPLASCVLLATGRLSSEMVIKAAQSGIPIAATLSIPTTLAVEVAEAAGIALVGRAMRPEPFVYGNRSRIKTD